MNFDISKILETEESSINWCQTNGLLNFMPLCSACESEMKVLMCENKEEAYRCTKESCKNESLLAATLLFIIQGYLCKKLCG